jgi:hypothetical protein
MLDTEMEDAEHANSSSATPKLYISDHTCETPGAIELILEILPAFNFRSNEVVLVELFIAGKLRGQRLFEGSSPDRKETFTVLDRYWDANQRNESGARKACFQITLGTLIRQAPSEPTSLRKIRGSTYEVFHQFTSRDLHEERHIYNNDIAERSTADDSDHESSQETFYDARSQFENVPGASIAEQEPIVEDLVAAGDDSPAEDEQISKSVPGASTAEEEPAIEDLAAAGDEPPAKDEHISKDVPGISTAEEEFTAEEEPTAEDLAAGGDYSSAEDQDFLTSGGTGSSASILTSPTGHNLLRLDQAKRAIFHEATSSSMELANAPSPSPMNASSPPVQDPDTEMFDDLASNTEQSEKVEIASHQKKPMQTFGTISGYLSSNKSAAQHGINGDSVDPEDEAASLVPSPKPLRRTSYAPSEPKFQQGTSYEPADSDDASKEALASEDSPGSDDDDTKPTAPTSKKPKDPVALKAYEKERAASGANVSTKLRSRLAENDKNIGGKASLKPWKGKHFGDNAVRRAANLRLNDMIKKQVKLHNLLSACSDANAASDLRQRLEPWAKGKIVEYESQLDTILSAVEESTSTDLAVSKQQANDDSADDSNDDFALPLLSTEQREMAAALLPEDQPVRKTVETTAHGNVGNDQEVQPSIPPTVNSRENDTPEDSDDDELPNFDEFFTPRVPGGWSTKPQSMRGPGKSLERAKKKPRME